MSRKSNIATGTQRVASAMGGRCRRPTGPNSLATAMCRITAKVDRQLLGILVSFVDQFPGFDVDLETLRSQVLPCTGLAKDISVVLGNWALRDK